jgi:Mg-chelatase subunit ChlI
MLVGTMNPEEGDLRPQLLDRFALCVDMRGISDPRQRVAIVERRLAYEDRRRRLLPGVGAARDAPVAGDCRGAQPPAGSPAHAAGPLSIASLTTSFKVDGHRADIVILKTARAHAAWQGHPAITEQDILLAAELALPHRLKRQPFEEASLDAGQLEDRLKKSRAGSSARHDAA